jgi:GT2 family glycosyltransferase
LEMQVQDEQRRWRTFFTTRIKVLPLDFVAQIGLGNVHEYLIGKFQARRASKSSHIECAPAQPRPHQNGTAISTKPVVMYATRRSNLFIREIGELVIAGFRELGCDATLLLDEVPVAGNNDIIQIVLTPHEYYNLFLLDQMPRKRARDFTRDLVLLCTEQPDTGWFQQNLRWGSYARAVADINPLGVSAYLAHGLHAHHLALGYHQVLRDDEVPQHSERKIEVMFLGSLTPRREQFFARHTDFFSTHNCHLRFVPLGFAKTELSRSYLPPLHRNRLLADTRVLLNVHYSDQQYFEWHRVLLGLANGCCIITERCTGYGPLIPNEHFVMVETDTLIPACEYYLNNPKECAGIAAAGREFVRKHLRQSRGCREFLQALDSDGPIFQSPSLINDPCPIELPLKLKQKFRHYHGKSFWSALGKDLRDMFSRLPGGSEKEPAAIEPSAVELAQCRAQIVLKRAGYQRRRYEQERRRLAGEEVWTLLDNAQFAHSEAPQLSVIITLYNYGRFLEDCANAIDNAVRLLTVPIEIVIVDDASTDDSCKHVQRVQKQLSRPVRLVRKRFNTGLADARNIGTQIARAPYVFMMDADNLVMPRAFLLLFDAMEAGQYAAVYSILCRFRGNPQNAVGLLSQCDWDPEILVQSPYVDAMAMFRRDVLLQLGGYDHALGEIGWFGWEDYDMWLRFAQHDLPVGFVPNILCLYRHHATSMINTTNLFAPELGRLFQERYQKLADSFPAREELFGINRQKLAPLPEQHPPESVSKP